MSRSVNPHAGFQIPRPVAATAHSFIADPGISATVPITSGVTGSKVIPAGFVDGGGDPYLNQVFDTYNNPKSQWELDDDTRDFLTDAFNTLNQEDEYLGGGESGGGGGGGGPGFSGGPGTQHGTTWSFGKNAAFKPQGIF